METVLPKKANWIKEKVSSIDPDNCVVTTNEGREVSTLQMCHPGFNRNGHNACKRAIVFVYICMYVYIHVCNSICMYICTYIRTYLHTYIYIYTYIDIDK